MTSGAYKTPDSSGRDKPFDEASAYAEAVADRSADKTQHKSFDKLRTSSQ